MQKYDTIIFDLDGTLLNTLDDLADSVNYALTHYDFPHKTTAEVRKFVGNGVARLMELSIPGGRDHPAYQSCLDQFSAYYAMNIQNKTKAYDGMMSLLGDLHRENYKLAIVSNKFDCGVKALCSAFFGEYIKVAVGESENVSRKPAPDAVFRAFEELGSAADRAVYVGDSEVDAQTAKNAGVQFVGVTWGFRDRDVLERNGAKNIIDKPYELMRLLS